MAVITEVILHQRGCESGSSASSEDSLGGSTMHSPRREAIAVNARINHAQLGRRHSCGRLCSPRVQQWCEGKLARPRIRAIRLPGGCGDTAINDIRITRISRSWRARDNRSVMATASVRTLCEVVRRWRRGQQAWAAGRCALVQATRRRGRLATVACRHAANLRSNLSYSVATPPSVLLCTFPIGETDCMGVCARRCEDASNRT